MSGFGGGILDAVKGSFLMMVGMKPVDSGANGGMVVLALSNSGYSVTS